MDELNLNKMADDVFDQIQKQKRKNLEPMEILEKYGKQIDIENNFKYQNINTLDSEPFYKSKNMSLSASEMLPFESGDYRIKKPISTGYKISRNGQIVSIQKNELTEKEKKLFNL